MKSRQLTFYVDSADLATVMEVVRDRVFPRYAALPHFLGLTAMKSDRDQRSEVIVTSFWDDGLQGSDDAAARFVSEIAELTGSNPIRATFDTLFAQVRDSTGTFCVGGMRWEGRPRNQTGAP